MMQEMTKALGPEIQKLADAEALELSVEGRLQIGGDPKEVAEMKADKAAEELIADEDAAVKQAKAGKKKAECAKAARKNVEDLKKESQSQGGRKGERGGKKEGTGSEG